MVQYTLVVLVATLCGAYGLGYELYDFISTGICQTKRSGLFDTFLSPQKEVKYLLSAPHRGAIYEQTWNSSSFKRYHECKFTIEAPHGMGVYLMIRKLKMRRDAKGYCIDLVTVKHSDNKKKTRFCYTPKDVPRSFSDDSSLKISIKLDHFVPLSTVEDTLEIQLVATPMVTCVYGHTMVQCDPDDYGSCINESFRRDGTINCPNCIDEDGCSIESEKVVAGDKQNIALTAFASLVLTMVVCCGCIWCLYRNRRCVSSCSNNSSGGSGADSDAGSRRVRAHHRRNVSADVLSVELPGSSADLRPSAPKLEEKDLPPSYDALFPIAEVASTASGPTTVSAATSPTLPTADGARVLRSAT